MLILRLVSEIYASFAIDFFRNILLASLICKSLAFDFYIYASPVIDFSDIR